jgi:hypothetical protein
VSGSPDFDMPRSYHDCCATVAVVFYYTSGDSFRVPLGSPVVD